MKNKNKIFCSLRMVAIFLAVCLSLFGINVYAQQGWNVDSLNMFGLSGAHVGDIVRAIMSWILGIISVIAIIAFAISGIQYLTSAGNENQIETAKKHMIWSIVGVLVAISGLVIIRAIDAALRGYTYF